MKVKCATVKLQIKIMDIKEIKLKKKNLESTILKLIRDFQKETELRAEDIRIIRSSRVLGDENYLDGIEMVAKL